MSNQQTIYNFLVNQAGLTPAEADGVLGNIQVESGFNPTATNANEGAIGIVQWEGGRRTALQHFAAARGTSETDLQTQLEFMLHEWRTSESAAYQKIKSATSAGQAAAMDDQYYERSSGSTRQQRIADALQLAGGAVMPDSAGSTQLAGGNLNAQDYKNELGSLASVLTAVPELKGLLDQAIKLQETPQQFQNNIENSKWYKQNSAAARQLIALRFSDPAEYASTLAQARQVVTQQAEQLGVQLNSKQVEGLATDYLTKSWNSQTLSNQIGGYYNGVATTGQAANFQQQLKQLYSEYGVPMGDQQINSQVTKLLEGQTTMDGYKLQAQQSAASLYPSIATQLQGGMTVKDVASPYIQTMSNILELNPNDISLNDPTIKRALQGTVTVQNGKSTATSTPLWQFEQQLRSDPRWQYTSNAHSAVASFVTQLGKDWGFLG